LDTGLSYGDTNSNALPGYRPFWFCRFHVGGATIASQEQIAAFVEYMRAAFPEPPATILQALATFILAGRVTFAILAARDARRAAEARGGG
jgi:hypothetical protein